MKYSMFWKERKIHIETTANGWTTNSKMVDSCPSRSVIPSNVNGLNQLNCKENTERLQRKKRYTVFKKYTLNIKYKHIGSKWQNMINICMFNKRKLRIEIEVCLEQPDSDVIHRGGENRRITSLGSTKNNSAMNTVFVKIISY